MLPTHVNGSVPITTSTTRRRRGQGNTTSERTLLLLVFAAFCLVCFGAFFFLPELSKSAQRTSGDVHMGVGNGRGSLSLEDLLEEEEKKQKELHNELERQKSEEAAAREREIVALQRQIEGLKNENSQLRSHESLSQQQAKDSAPQLHLPPNVANPPPRDTNVGGAAVGGRAAVGAGAGAGAVGGGGQSYDTPQAKMRREFVKKMTKTAWDGYATYAMGTNELMPKAKRGHSAGIFGSTRMGATVVDAIDTLFIMGLHDEVKVARDWVATQLSFDVSAGVSVFEINIRFVGGLLAAYALTKDDIFKAKAVDVAQRLLPAFNTKTGVPKAMVNLRTGASHNWGWASGGASILSEFGTMQLEFEYLSKVSGNPVFLEKSKRAMRFAIDLPKPSNGMYPNYLHPDTGRWGSNDVSLGALGDSFYEYLLKLWIYSGGRTRSDPAGRKDFDDAMIPVREKLVHHSSKSNLVYVAEAKGNAIQHKMGHLACFTGGMFGMAARAAPSKEWADWYLETAAGVTETCHEGYRRTATGLGPETMYFDGNNEASCSRAGERYYILRPETVEAYFYLWRLTHEQKYRDWAWEAVEAIEKNCRCGEGYCGIKDVNAQHAVQDDVQQSFFLAETLKYLYLIFCDDDVMSLDEWVFNTEAHAFPIEK